jgi:uncharacterized protein with HEPN domain
MPKRDNGRLEDMLDAARKAVGFTKDRSRKDLDEDEMLSLALVRLLEIIGEAARFVPEEIRNTHPKVPWREIASTRNRLIHGYFAVDLDVIWAIVKQDIPPLINQLEDILNGD